MMRAVAVLATLFIMMTSASLALADDKLCPCMERAISKSEFRACYIESDLPVPPDPAFDMIMGSYMAFRQMYGHGPSHGHDSGQKTGAETVSFESARTTASRGRGERRPANAPANNPVQSAEPAPPPALSPIVFAPDRPERPTTVTQPAQPIDLKK